MTTIQHLETMVDIARHIALYGDPEEKRRAVRRVIQYRRAIMLLWEAGEHRGAARAVEAAMIAIVAIVAIAYLVGDYHGWMDRGRADREEQERVRWERLSTAEKLADLTRQVEALKLKQRRWS